MKNIWKWALGIILVLIVAAGLFGLGFVHRTRMMAHYAPNGAAPMMREKFHGDVPAHGMMQMRGFRHGPRHGGMFKTLIPLALGLLLLYGAYRLGMKHTAPVAAATPAPPAAATTSHACPTCGSSVQDGWNHCPNCGEKQT